MSSSRCLEATRSVTLSLYNVNSFVAGVQDFRKSIVPFVSCNYEQQAGFLIESQSKIEVPSSVMLAYCSLYDFD
jgi:hypothetical protein